MASISQRGPVWRAHVRRAGKTLTATFDSHAAALDWATVAEARLIKGAAPAVAKAPSDYPTVAKLFGRYAAEVSPGKGGARWEKLRLKALVRDFALFDRPATELDASALCEWRDARLHQVAASTVNRELNLISAVLTRAIKEWRVDLAVNPVHNVMRPRNPAARTRRVSSDERALIAAELEWEPGTAPITVKQWTAFAFYLAIETAMRKGEILALTWGNVHLDQCYLHLPTTKNGDSRDVPLSSRALALLAILDPGKPKERVVPLTAGTLDMTFRRAKIDAGLSDIRFHDSRREAATVFSESLPNVLELAAVTGHRSLQTLRVYYRPKPGDLARKLG